MYKKHKNISWKRNIQTIHQTLLEFIDINTKRIVYTLEHFVLIKMQYILYLIRISFFFSMIMYYVINIVWIMLYEELVMILEQLQIHIAYNMLRKEIVMVLDLNRSILIIIC